MTKQPSLASDALFNTLSFAVRMVGAVAALALVARALGPENNGRFGWVQWLAAVLAQVGLWGLGVAAARFVARALAAGRPEEARRSVAMTGRWLGVTLVPTAGIAGLLAARFGGDLRDPLLMGVLFFVVLALSTWRVQVAWGLRRFDVVLAGHVLFFLLLLPLLLLYASHGVVAALGCFVLSRLAQLGLMWTWTAHLLRTAASQATGVSSSEGEDALRRELRSFALHMAGIAVLSAVVWERTELAFLGSLGRWDEVGWYTAAVGLSMLVMRVPGVLGTVVLPVAAAMEGRKSSSVQMGVAWRQAAAVLTLGMAGPVLVCILIAPDLVLLLFGEAFAPAGPLLQILLGPLVLTGLGATGAKMLIGAGNHRYQLRVVAAGAALKLALCIALIPALGFWGAALACAVSQGIALALEGLTAARCFPLQGGASSFRPIRQAAVALAAASGALGIGWLVPGTGSLPLLAQSLGALVGWSAAVAVFRPLDGETRQRLYLQLITLRRGSP